MELVYEDRVDHHTELKAELTGIEIENMILGTAEVENELSYSQTSASAARNSNRTTGITGLSVILDQSPEVAIDEENDIEGDIDSLGD